MLEGYPREAALRRVARAAAERSEFARPLFAPSRRVIDLGCGPGSLTVAFEAPASSTVDYLKAAPGALPFPGESLDLAFAPALVERLADPGPLLAELHRVLRPGGRLALSTLDWSRARLRPKTANVDAALRGYYLLLRRAGGNPFAGRRIAEHVAAAGFTAVTARTRYRADLAYRDLAAHVERALAKALDEPGHPDRDQLTSAARSAWSWTRSAGSGDFTQCWTELLATR
ncbi:methyltransferase domain-containing protein [Amycolatopsis sp. PS_44_ISF1]|uniref:methyltransferase domain-containing protein n=1 Tax=Amycolatopsis sp. PS_44_ISF1 TaxID=2974917 RepID=UPI0028DF6FEE|nr:methyltransferase domain-containing protein [Amycolatopsis sp. PS_44_ISF1]MDT8910835.1 methyltransferase domain-containing protein [Amycolatopsis sp. PS_44_ISF1]